MKLFSSLFILLFFSTFYLGSQNATDIGYPIITNFNQKDIGGSQGNRGIVQDSRGVMYFGNNHYLLEYDGVSWRQHLTSKNINIIALAIGDDDIIYVGAYGDLGYFKRNDLGKLEYYSIKEHLPEEHQNFSQIQSVYKAGGKVYFKTFNFYTANIIAVWDTVSEEFSDIMIQEFPAHIFLANDVIYKQIYGKGLKQLVGDEFVFLNDGETFAERIIMDIIPSENSSTDILVITAQEGIFLYDGNTFSPYFTTNFSNLENWFTSGVVLNNGNILLSTINTGVFEINSEGKELRKYDEESGLGSNLVSSLFKDRVGDIWVSTQNEISRLVMSSPILSFDRRSGLSNYISNFFKHDDRIYAGGYVGALFSYNELSRQFEAIEELKNTQINWISQLEDELILSTSDGLKILKEDNKIVSMFSDGIRLPWSLKMRPSDFYSDRFFLFSVRGVWIIRNDGKHWVDEGLFFETKAQVWSVAEIDENSMWVGTSEGLFLLEYSTNNNTGELVLTENVIKNFTTGYGLQKGKVRPLKISDEIYFASEDSLYVFDSVKNRFISDVGNPLIKYFTDFPTGSDGSKDIEQDNLGNIWIYSSKRISLGTIEDGEKYQWITTPFNRLIEEGFSHLFSEGNGLFWFNTFNGLVRYDLSKAKKIHPDFPTLIRQVAVSGDSILYYGGGKVSDLTPVEINFSNNSIRFDYSATRFEDRGLLRFSTFLDGYDDNWTGWATETHREFTNLSPGSYTFKVKAMDVGAIEGLPASYSFIVLPPWYMTWWANIMYLLILLGIIYLFSWWRTQKLKKVNLELEEKVKERTQQLEKKSDDLSESLIKLQSTQAQLIQQEKLASLGQLTAGIAHEIKNPLNFVNNFSDVSIEIIEETLEEMSKQAAKDEKLIQENLEDIQSNLEKIHEHGSRADSIVKSMLMHSRGGSGKMEPTDLNALIKEYVNLSFHGMRASKNPINVDIQLDLDESINKVDLVGEDFSRVILNLCSNAFDAMRTANPEGLGFLNVRTKKQKDTITIEIEDNGPGIPDEMKDKILQPFFTTKKGTEGTGLGLSITNDIVKAHGGVIEIESKVGEGTKFILTLSV